MSFSNASDYNVTFSIVMPTYNSQAYVSEAVESVLAQTFSDWELLIVDDCSTDETVSLIREYESRDSRIRVSVRRENGGGAKARNVAISQALGRYIAFLDSDDIWLKEKLERQLELFESTCAPLVYASYEKVDENGTRAGRMISVPERIDYHGLLDETVIATVTAAYDTRSVGKVLMPDIRKRQDYALWLKILRKGGEAHAVTEPLAFLRKRAGSVSSNKFSAALYVWKVYRNIEKLSLRASVLHFGHYAYNAFHKHRR